MPLGGFLLNDDATDARTSEFDRWVQEQKQRAQDVATAAQTTVSQAVAPAAQAVAPAAQQINTNLSQFDQWAEEQRAAAAQKLAEAQAQAPQPQTAPQAAPQPDQTVPQAAPQGPLSGASSFTQPDQTQPAAPATDSHPLVGQFDQWADEQRRQAQAALQNATSTAGGVASNLGGFAGQATTGAGAALGGLIDQKASELEQAVRSAPEAAGSAVSAAGGAVSGALPGGKPAGFNDISQRGDPQLTAAEAEAACGPAAAVRFAQFYGRNPTLREATDLAASVGWTSANGMAGLASEKALMDKLGVDTHMVGASWDAISKEAQTGNPVTISTPGHYFFADGYDPSTGAFHVGRSGLDLRRGSEWMTPAQMESAMGGLQGALFADHPAVPGGGGKPPADTTAAAPTSAARTSTSGAPTGAIDASSPEAFAKSFAPYAQYAAQKLGIDPKWVTAMAASESNYGKADAAGHELFGVKALPGQPGTVLATHEGEYGGSNVDQTFAAYESPLAAVDAWVNLLQNHYKGAVNAQDLPSFVHGLKSGGYFTAAEKEYLDIVSGISNRLGGQVDSALSGAGQALSGAGQAVSNAGQAATQAGADALNATTSASTDIAQRAEDLRQQGATKLLELQNQLRSSQSAFDQESQDAAARNQKWRDQVAADAERTRQELLKPRDFSFLDTARQGIQDTAGNYARAALDVAPSPAGATLGDNLRDIQAAPSNLQLLGQGVAAANDEAVRQRADQSPLAPGVSALEAVTGRQVPEDVRAGILNAPPPPGAQVPDISGPLSDFLKTSRVLPAEQTVDLPFLGRTPLADIVGQAANFLVPVGAEERFAGGAEGALGRAAGRAAVPGAQLPIAAAIGNKAAATRVAVSAAGRWARSSVEDIMSDLAKGPIGDFVTDASGTLDVDKLREIASSVKDQMTRMYHGTGADFPTVDPQAVSGEGNLFGPGYYLTSSPEVAGGVVSEGGEQVGPSWLRSSVKRPGGAVISPGYAQQRVGDFTNLQADLRDIQTRLADPALSDRQRYMLEQRQASVQAEMDAYNPSSGPNVRPVDVPQDLKLFDIEQPVPPDQAEAIATRLWGPDALSDPDTAAEVASWSKPGVDGASVYDVIRGEVGGTKAAANKVLADAGFDGLSYSGGQRIPMTDAAGAPIQHTANVIFPESLDKVRNAVSMRQGGAAGTGFAMRLGGAAAGVGSQEATMSDQDKQDPWGRFGRDIAAGVLGSAAPGAAVGLTQRGLYNDVRGLRVVQPTLFTAAGGRGTPAELTSAVTKDFLLSGPKTHLTNILTQLAELARQPVATALSGREDDAVVGLKTAASAVPDAFSNFVKTMKSGGSAYQPTGRPNTPVYTPFLRLLGATDDFFRTIGWAMGAGQEGNRALREGAASGLSPSAILASKQSAIDKAGQTAGSLSVFGEGGSPGAHAITDLKNKLLGAKGDYGKQALGMMLDAGVPFAAIPGRIWNIGLKRIPGVGELDAVARAGIAFKKGDTEAMRKALGDGLTQSVATAAILSNVANGNIRGPDDAEHPSGVKIGGQWYDYSNWGAWALPMAIPAAIYESAQKEGNKPNPNQITAAINAMGKAMGNQFYLADLVKTLNQVGEGNASGAIGQLAGSYADRYLPYSGALNQATAAWDPILRDTTRDNPLLTVIARQQAKIPGLESQLPAQPVMTSGQPQERRSAGLGELVGMQTRPASKLETEIAALERGGYKINDPTKAPTEVSLGGASVPLTDDEQRKVAEARGKLIDQALQAQMSSATWDRMPDQQKALTLNAIMSSVDSQNAALWASMTAPAELQRRIGQGQRIAGKLQPVGAS